MSGSSGKRSEPTLEQAMALGVVGSSVALGAGAGCGKTFVLAERFVRALEGPEGLPLGRIVALTFTNKAARELRERIRKECRARLAEGQDPPRWRAVLRGLQAARVGTFHSFCGDVLRRYAVEAGIDPGFAVFDETIALSLREEALASSLRERLAARDADLIGLAVEYGLGMVRRSIDDLLAHRSAGDLRDWASRSPRELVDAWLRIWVEEVQPAMIRGFLEDWKPCLDRIASTTFDDPKVRGKIGELLEAVAVLDRPGDPKLALEAISGAAKVQGLAAKLWPDLDFHEWAKAQFTAVRADCKRLVEAFRWEETTSLTAASHGLMFARLTLRARETYDEVKRSRGGIDNDDLLLKTRDLLADPSNGVRGALAGSIDLVLVDEFQDTDPVQSEILEALGGDRLLDGKLFLVGDFKQSIYRFRGAQPELFQDYRGRFPEAGRLALSANFRSVPAILDFVNALFADTFPEPEAALRPGDPTRSLGGPPAVEFLWLPTSEGASPARPDAGDRRKEEARRLAGHLKDRLDADWMIRDRHGKGMRRANAGDVAILFRSLSDSSDYEQALVAEGLDFHVVGGSGFYAQQEVLDLINVLTAVDNPLDAVALAGALRSPFFSISDDALFWIATERKGSPHEGLELCAGPLLEKLPEIDRPRASRARKLLESWRGWKDREPIASLVDRILVESGYEAALIGESLGDRKRANARKLVRIARRFDGPGGFTLADFVDRLRSDLKGATKETQAATTDEEGEVIRLMSVHQAKGLEFPIVVLPDLDRKRPGELKRVAFDPTLGPLVNPIIESANGLEEDDAEPGNCLGWTIHRHRERAADDAEALRLFYVAATRARDALILSSATDPSKKPTSPALGLLDRRFDRSTGLLRTSLPEGWIAPNVRVVEGLSETTRRSTDGSRVRPRLLEVASIIREGLAAPRDSAPSTEIRPRFVELDPAQGLSSSAARLDRLIRTILADPRSLEPGRLEAIAWKAARLQNPVAPEGIVRKAIERVGAWSRSPLAREIARAEVVTRRFPWLVRRPHESGTVTFRGQGDFLYRLLDGTWTVVNFADPDASPGRERLRLLLAIEAAEERTKGPIRQGWRVGLGAGGKVFGESGSRRPPIEELFGLVKDAISGP